MSLRDFTEGTDGLPACRIAALSQPHLGADMTDAIPPAPSLQTKAGLTISARGILEQYGIAVIGVALALAVRLALTSVLSGQESSVLFPGGACGLCCGRMGSGVLPRY